MKVCNPFQSFMYLDRNRSQSLISHIADRYLNLLTKVLIYEKIKTSASRVIAAGDTVRDLFSCQIFKIRGYNSYCKRRRRQSLRGYFI